MYNNTYDSISIFIQSLNKASVTYKGEVIEINGDSLVNEEIRFNFSNGIADYQGTLNNQYNDATQLINSKLMQIYHKANKLIYINKLYADIVAMQLLLNKDSGKYTHRLFTSSNISEEEPYVSYKITEDNIQDQYYWMNHYLYKFKFYLELLKQTVEISVENDFPLPNDLSVDPNASTTDKPLEFMSHFFTRNGFNQLYQSFLPTEEDDEYGYIEKYDKENEVITYEDYNPDTDQYEVWKKDFKIILQNKLVEEYLNSRKLLEYHIDSLHTIEEIKLFLLQTIYKIKYLRFSILNNVNLNKYPINVLVTEALIKHIYIKYAPFCPEPDEEINALVLKPDSNIKIQQNIPQLPKSRIKAFEWKTKDTVRNTTILFQKLTSHQIIHKETDMTIFHNCFTGVSLEQPQQIKWIDKAKSGYYNKASLFYLLNTLAANNLIHENSDNTTLFKRIMMIFVKGDGKPFENLKVSNTTSSNPNIKKTKTQKNIDSIIKVLLNVKSVI